MLDKTVVTQYRYTWRGEARTMTVALDRTACTVTDDADGNVSRLTWDGKSLAGAGLSDMRRREIAALLTAAMQPI
jgi:hypothetical protein